MEIISDSETIKKLVEKKKYQKIKITLYGIEKSGKSTFLKRIVSKIHFNNFKDSIKIYNPTIGAFYCQIFLKFKDKSFLIDFWDTSGQLRFSPLIKYFSKDAHIILNFYDPFNKDSFEYIKNCRQGIKQVNNLLHCTSILIKNKCDLNETKNKNIMVSDEEVLEYADKNNLLFRNLSNLEKHGSGIEEIIEDCINGYLHKNNENDKLLN